VPDAVVRSRVGAPARDTRGRRRSNRACLGFSRSSALRRRWRWRWRGEPTGVPSPLDLRPAPPGGGTGVSALSVATPRRVLSVVRSYRRRSREGSANGAAPMRYGIFAFAPVLRRGDGDAPAIIGSVSSELRGSLPRSSLSRAAAIGRKARLCLRVGRRGNELGTSL